MTGERIARSLREELVKRALGMDMAFYDVERPDMTVMLTAHTQTIQMGTSEKVGLFIQSISYFVAAFVVGFILNPTLTGILLAAIIPSMVFIVVTGTNLVSRLSKRASKFAERASDVAGGCIDSVQVVQAFGAIRTLSALHKTALSDAVHLGLWKSFFAAIMLGLVYFVSYSVNALAFYEGSRLTSGGGAGTIYAVVFLILDASFVVGQFGPFIQIFAQAASAGGKVFEILNHKACKIDVYKNEGDRCNQETFRFGEITLHDVSFFYPVRPTIPVLRHANVKFKAGTLTGVCGLSGSGKSSLVSLLLRLYDPASGEVAIGDASVGTSKDFRSLHIPTLRSHVAILDQDPVLFSGTILENICHGIPNLHEISADEAFSRCKQAADDANAIFIFDLADGMYTQVAGAGGTSLSGGQRQRICLARALIRNPSVLILDEPTSALDATSETYILGSLRKASRTGCTVIMIAHRLATIRDADNIIVVVDGSIHEEGTHEQLLGRDGPYKRLVDAQGFQSSEDLRSITSSTTSKSASTGSSVAFEKSAMKKEGDLEVPKAESPPNWSVLYLINRCLRLSRPERPYLLLGLFGSLLSGCIIIGEAIISGHLVDILNTKESASALGQQVNFFCLMFFIVSLVALFAYSISGIAFGVVSESLILRVRDLSLQNILRQDLAWFSEPGRSSHKLMAALNMDVGHLSGLSGVIIGTVLSVITSVTGGIILAHIIAWRIAVVLLAAVPVMILAGFLRLRVLSKFEQRHETAYNEAAAIASEACQNIRTVAAFGLEREILKKYRTAIEEPYEKSFRFIVIGNSMLAFSLAVTYFVYSLAYYWGSRQVRDGNYTQQDFFIVLPALLFSAQASGQLFSLAPEVTRAKKAATNIFHLHDQKPTIMDDLEPDTQHPAPQSNKPSTLTTTHDESPTISFNAVHLHYPIRPTEPILRNLTLNVPRPSFVGIVGPSGAGKSSLISLLLRFYDPTSGSIHLSRQEIRSLPVSQHRARLSLVPQEPDLFPGTIAFNVRLGARPSAQDTVTQSRVEEVCAAVGLHEFIASLPEGYGTDCGHNGAHLSGGQKQRLAVARALVRDPDVLLLDEATASLDSRSEGEVLRAVRGRGREGRITLCVAHRLSTVRDADWIFVVDHGRVVEEGDHGALIERGGVYAGMARKLQVG